MGTWQEDPKIRRLAEAYDLAQGAQRAEIARLIAQERPAAIERAELAEEIGPGQAMALGAMNEFMRLSEGARMLVGGEEDVARERQKRTERESMYDPIKEVRPLSAAVGEIATGALVPGGAGATLPRRLAGAALAGGGYEYVGSGGDPGAAAIAATTAPVFSEAARIGGRWLLGNPDAPFVGPGHAGTEHRRLVGEAERLGRVQTPAAEMANPSLGQYEASMARSPYMSAPFVEQMEQNQTLANRFARQALGLQGDDIITDEVLNARASSLSNEFERIVGTDESFPVSEDFSDMIGDIEAEHMRGLTRSAQGRRVLRNLREISDDQYMTVRDYQQIASDLARLGRSLRNEDPSASRAMLNAREVLDAEFDAEFGDLPDLVENRRLWRRLRQIEDSKAIRQGNFRPTIFYNYLRGAREGRGRVRNVQGNLENLSRLESYFASRVPNSGTPTGQAVPDFIQASGLSKLQMALGNELSRAYMANPRILAGPGGMGYIPDFARPFIGPAQVGLQRAGRQYGVQESQGEGLVSY